MTTQSTSPTAPLDERLRPYVELTLAADLVTADRCKRIAAGAVIVCRFQEPGRGGRHLVRVWRKGTTPQDGLTANIDELLLSATAASLA